MKTRMIGLVAGLLVAVCGLAAYGWQRDGSPSAATNAFRVTNWPPDDADEDYAKAVERHLNKLAGDGWRFKSTMEGNKAKLMVFERAG